MSKPRMEDWNIRKNSLRLRNFDYSANRCYFVTLVTSKRQKFFLESRIADETEKRLLDLRGDYKFNLYSYCLMPDHLHALIGLGESGLSLGRICGNFKSLSTREFWKYKDGKLWQLRFHDHIIRDERDFFDTIDYIRMNPVEAGLVDDWTKWKYRGEPDLK